MPESVSFRIPYPPSINNYYQPRVVGKGRRFIGMRISEDVASYRERVRLAVIERFGTGLRPLRCRLKVTVLFVAPDRRVRDWDNINKGAMDALTHARVWEDDQLIDEARIIRGPVRKPGWLEITLEKAETND